MRTDKIDERAYQQALELYSYSERGFHGTGSDAADVPVLAPQVSKLKKEDEPWQPESAFYGNKPVGTGGKTFNYGEEQGTGEYNAMDRELTRLMDEQERLSGDLRRARQRGNFQEEHRIVKARNAVIKAISAVQARMSVNDLGRAQRELNDGLMYDSQNTKDLNNPFMGFSEYVNKIEENDERISRLEAALLEFAEKGKNIKSTGGDSAADPGQSYSPADNEEADEEDDEEEIED